MFDLSIQIVNYNTKKYLVGCLDSILKDLKNSNISYKILILDNDSSDDLGDLQLKYKQHNQIEFYKNNKNVGFGGGHNILAKKIDAKYLLILNPDILFIEEKTISRMLDCFLSDSSVKIVGPKLVNKNGRQQAWDYGELHSLLARLLGSIGISFWRPQNKVIEAAWVSGAVFLIERNIFDELHGFDDKIFLYYEELELCLRARQNKAKVMYDPAIKVLHVGLPSSSRNRYMFTSYGYVLDKHYKNNILYYPLKLTAKLLETIFK
ncbi:MAG: glycosyltransferase family 2 protein [Patescibacteria group bacterium]|jgi:hypothetical protein